MSLQGNRILLCVSGSIAAYKAADVCSRLIKLGADVQVAMTPNARAFVGAPTFLALSRRPVLTGIFDEPSADRIAHIDAAQSASLVLAAPASANLLARMAAGIADDIVTTCLLAVPRDTPLYVAPAMNTVMWDHPATRANLSKLVERGVHVIPPGAGILACQDEGQGRLAEPAEIVDAVLAALCKRGDLSGRTVMVTAGATREPLDPVRFLSNRSSGKMGYALAEEARRRGAAVVLVTAAADVCPPAGVEIVRAETAQQMLAACLEHSDRCDVIIGAAAVSDYAPAAVSAQKIKKRSEASGNMSLDLVQNPDVIGTLSARRRPGQLIMGFAAETEELLPNARIKLESKGLDLIAANDVTAADSGFGSETNLVTLLGRNGFEQRLPLLPKREVAARILDVIGAILAPQPPPQ